MNETLKKFLLESVVGLIFAILLSILLGLFDAQNSADTLRILSDAFFVSAAVFLVSGGITFTVNGGVMDGLGFAAKTGIARVKRDFETSKISFAEYREERERKAKSPAASLRAGALLLVIALILLAFYNNAIA